jgi:antitoxin FitA
MSVLTIEISEERFIQLQQMSARYGISIDDLLRLGIENLLTRLDKKFDEEVEFILNENEELYRRLA